MFIMTPPVVSHPAHRKHAEMFYLFCIFNLSAVPLKTFSAMITAMSGLSMSVPSFCFLYSIFISEIAHLRLLSFCHSDSHQRCEWRSWGRDGSQVNWHLIWDIRPLEPLFKAMSVKYYMCHNCIIDCLVGAQTKHITAGTGLRSQARGWRTEEMRKQIREVR